MPDAYPPEPGEVYTHDRTFSTDDVRRFGSVSGDQQAIHTEPDDDGRLVVQGLLTATLPTKIGGDLGVIARTMDFTFHQPVHTGDTITCEWTTDTVTDRPDRYEITSSVACTNQDGDTVMDATIEGIIRKPDAETG